MNVIREAVDAVQRNLAALALLVAATLVLTTPKLIADLVIIDRFGLETPPYWHVYYELATLLPMAVGMAAAITIAFGWMAREIDKPLWKMRGVRDALQRFGSYWFAIYVAASLCMIVAGRLQAADALPALSLLLFLMYCALFVVNIPVGAALMFLGHIRRDTVGEALAPLANQWAKTAVVLFVGIWQFFLLVYISSAVVHGDNALWQRALLGVALHVILVYLDCLIFAATVLVCRFDRDTHEEVDLDF